MPEHRHSKRFSPSSVIQKLVPVLLVVLVFVLLIVLVIIGLSLLGATPSIYST